MPRWSSSPSAYSSAETFIELVLFDKPRDARAVKSGKIGFAANAAAVIVKAGAAATTGAHAPVV